MNHSNAFTFLLLKMSCTGKRAGATGGSSLSHVLNRSCALCVSGGLVVVDGTAAGMIVFDVLVYGSHTIEGVAASTLALWGALFETPDFSML